MKSLDTQIGGSHYTGLKIQPMEYSMANNLDACQHSVVKYITRFRDKGGVSDLKKAKHVIDMLIEFEGSEKNSDRMPMDDLDDGDPWIKWDGNKNGPLTNKEVEIQFRGGHGQDAHASDFVSNFYWGHDSKDYDIIAYRIVK